MQEEGICMYAFLMEVGSDDGFFQRWRFLLIRVSLLVCFHVSVLLYCLAGSMPFSFFLSLCFSFLWWINTPKAWIRESQRKEKYLHE